MKRAILQLVWGSSGKQFGLGFFLMTASRGFLFACSGVTHWIPPNQFLIVGHRRQPDDGDDGVENKGDEEVLVQGDSLAT